MLYKLVNVLEMNCERSFLKNFYMSREKDVVSDKVLKVFRLTFNIALTFREPS